MGEDVAVVSDCKSVAVNTQLGRMHTNTHQMVSRQSILNCHLGPIKLFVFCYQQNLFLVKLTEMHNERRVVQLIYVCTNNTLSVVKILHQSNLPIQKYKEYAQGTYHNAVVYIRCTFPVIIGHE